MPGCVKNKQKKLNHFLHFSCTEKLSELITYVIIVLSYSTHSKTYRY